jgi:hypothetical protein
MNKAKEDSIGYHEYCQNINGSNYDNVCVVIKTMLVNTGYTHTCCKKSQEIGGVKTRGVEVRGFVFKATETCKQVYCPCPSSTTQHL